LRVSAELLNNVANVGGALPAVGE